MICVSILGRSNEETLRMMSEAAADADMLELRIDGIPHPDLRRLLSSKPRPVIVTNRPALEGGHYVGSEARRLQLLEEAALLGADYVDVELEAAQSVRAKGARRIISFHDFKGTHPDLGAIRKKCVEAGADVAKVVVTSKNVMDNLPVFRLLQSATDGIPTIAICMGEHGLISRILAPKYGGFLTFAAAKVGDEVRPTAPGQITAARLRDEFRFRAVKPSTAVYGVIGNPIAHSLSPAVHNAAFEKLGLDAVYVPFLVEDVSSFLPPFRAIGVKGFSVTIPHKEAVMSVADEVDEIASRIGAANTLYERDGRLRATNTDCLAAVTALENGLVERDGVGASLRGKRVVVLGAGGAARAVVFGLMDRGADVTIVNRTSERGSRLAAEADKVAPGQCRSMGQEALTGLRFDILCNLTSVGMHPDVNVSPIPARLLKPDHVVFDAVYNPLDTHLLKAAREVGATIVPGLDWFIGQAAEQFRLWTGIEPPVHVMRHVAWERLIQAQGTRK